MPTLDVLVSMSGFLSITGIAPRAISSRTGCPSLVGQPEAGVAQQSEERRPPVGLAAEVVQVAGLGQGKRAPPPSECRPEASRTVASAAVGVKHTPHDARSGQPAQTVHGQSGAAR